MPPEHCPAPPPHPSLPTGGCVPFAFLPAFLVLGDGDIRSLLWRAVRTVACVLSCVGCMKSFRGALFSPLKSVL